MAKNIGKKGHYQGMEHLMPEITSNKDNRDNTRRYHSESEQNHLKRDLITILVLMLVFVGVLVGLTIIDNNTLYLDRLAGIFISFSQ